MAAPDVEGYIRGAAVARGIDPDVAVRVALGEGGLVPNRTGSFATGKSFWPFQLHYGGAGTPYAQYGTVAGMGNSFTAATGWQPGDPNAWQAATDYALDAAKRQGWGAWYGARSQGITGFQGIDRGAPAARGAPTPAPAPAPAAAGPATVAAEDAPDWLQQSWAAGGTVGKGTGRVEALPNAPPGRDGRVAPLPNAPTGPATGTLEPLGTASGEELWPVVGQPWGKVNNPFGGVQSRSAGATVALPSRNVGADLTGGYGAQVVAPVAGTVVQVYDAPNETDRNLNSGWGGMTLLRGDNGYFYRLSHAKPGSIATQPGQRVTQGQLLQQVGVSGNSTGAHLDYEKFAQPGQFVDPVATRGRAASAPQGGAGAAGGEGPWRIDPGAAPDWLKQAWDAGSTIGKGSPAAGTGIASGVASGLGTAAGAAGDAWKVAADTAPDWLQQAWGAGSTLGRDAGAAARPAAAAATGAVGSAAAGAAKVVGDAAPDWLKQAWDAGSTFGR
jgi:murein DD-endopeptidase MepM/ murein hydrolase activator NlpD